MTDFDYTTLRVSATGLGFPEGPIALDDGTLLVAEIEGGSLARVAPDGGVDRFVCGGGPNGAALGPDGAVYVCNNGGLLFRTTAEGVREPFDAAPGSNGGSIQRVDLAAGTVTTVFSQSGGAPLGNLNDIVFDDVGGAYVVDTTRGVLHYADPLKGTIAVAAEGLSYPNGAGLSPDGKTLYVSETFAGRLIAIDVLGPGRLGEQRELYSAGGAHGFDGLAVDGAGNICVANLTHSGISVISPSGTLLGAFRTPTHDPYVTNICFGGPGGDTAFICSAGRGLAYAIQWPWPGLRLNFAR